MALIRSVDARRRVVGADINELVKIPGTQVSEFTAAKIAAKIIVHCVMAAEVVDEVDQLVAGQFVMPVEAEPQ